MLEKTATFQLTA